MTNIVCFSQHLTAYKCWSKLARSSASGLCPSSIYQGYMDAGLYARAMYAGSFCGISL